MLQASRGASWTRGMTGWEDQARAWARRRQQPEARGPVAPPGRGRARRACSAGGGCGCARCWSRPTWPRRSPRWTGRRRGGAAPRDRARSGTRGARAGRRRRRWRSWHRCLLPGMRPAARSPTACPQIPGSVSSMRPERRHSRRDQEPRAFRFRTIYLRSTDILRGRRWTASCAGRPSIGFPELCRSLGLDPDGCSRASASTWTSLAPGQVDPRRSGRPGAGAGGRRIGLRQTSPSGSTGGAGSPTWGRCAWSSARNRTCAARWIVLIRYQHAYNGVIDLRLVETGDLATVQVWMDFGQPLPVRQSLDADHRRRWCPPSAG